MYKVHKLLGSVYFFSYLKLGKKNRPFWAPALLRRFCQIKSGYGFLTFSNNNYYMGKETRGSVYMCPCIYVSMYICVHVYVSMYICVHVYVMCPCICVSMYICVHVYVCPCICVSMYMCPCICVSMYMRPCIYVYVTQWTAARNKLVSLNSCWPQPRGQSCAVQYSCRSQ
jgi:hypothetical protein